MKIVHVSTSDKSGGAAIATFRLNEAMRLHQIDSKMLVYNKSSEEKSVVQIRGFFLKARYLLFFYLSLICKRLVLKSPFPLSFGLFSASHVSRSRLLKEADVIYLHFVNCGFLSIKEISSILSLGKPVIFFMHDMWILTGGCHYSFDCDKYMSYCSDCPNIQCKLLKNIVSYNFGRKQKKLSSKSNFFIVAPSLWLANCAKQSALFKGNAVSYIPNTLNISLFKPVEKSMARKHLNLPLNKKLILFGADGGSKNKYKGWEFLKKALHTLKIAGSEFEIIVFGNELDESAKVDIPFVVHSMGHIADIESLVFLYNAADVLVTPSLAEAFGQTIFESQACGTLVVGFNVGGIPDLIKHYQTGYLAKYKDSDDLALGIEWALQHKDDKVLIDEMRQFVVNHFSYEVVSQKHLDMVRTISYHR